jgi:Arm domain-containing DNA-binding protein
MPQKNLTQLTVEKLAPPKAGRVVHWDKLLPGFGLRMTANGAKSWIAMYRVNGQTVMETLGGLAKIPKVADARTLARESMAKAATGVATPSVLVDWLPGYTREQMNTPDEKVTVRLAEAEFARRGPLRAARASAVAGGFSAAVAIIVAVGTLWAGDSKATAYAHCQMAVLSAKPPPEGLLSVCMRAAGYKDTCGSPPGMIPECFAPGTLVLQIRDAIW